MVWQVLQPWILLLFTYCEHRQWRTRSLHTCPLPRERKLQVGQRSSYYKPEDRNITQHCEQGGTETGIHHHFLSGFSSREEITRDIVISLFLSSKQAQKHSHHGWNDSMCLQAPPSAARHSPEVTECVFVFSSNGTPCLSNAADDQLLRATNTLHSLSYFHSTLSKLCNVSHPLIDGKKP